MRKLRLEIDELQIESFDTTSEKNEDGGSVEGFQTPTANSGGSCFESTCRPILCKTDDTCYDTCRITCPFTCDDAGCTN